MQNKPESEAWLRFKATGDKLKKGSTTSDRHYTEEHRLNCCTCWNPDQWPKVEFKATTTGIPGKFGKITETPGFPVKYSKST